MGRRAISAALLITALVACPGVWAQETAKAHWNFDEIKAGKTSDIAGAIDDPVAGNFRLLPGVKGRALVMDGYTTCVIRDAAQAPELGPDFSIEAWVALGAYPWNWAPIASRENTVSLASNLDAACWPDDITVNSPRSGFYFGVGPQGQLGLHVGTEEWVVCQTDKALPLRKWTHVAATFKQGEGICLYINGQKAAAAAVQGKCLSAAGEALRIGMSRQKIEPSNPVRPFATLACWYSLDGILDELRIYGKTLSGEEVGAIFGANKPGVEPVLPERVMPSGPKGPGAFGASYARLEYTQEWDSLWPVSSDPDIVVQFDDSPVRVVFWRGTRYSPVWVMDKDLWMADQSIENFNDDDGCIEHMLDKHCRFSQVKIIENTEARVVVHWRYCPTSANGRHSQVDPVTGWEDWVDEYYTFYPDQIGIRKVIQHTKGESLGPEEVIVLCHPGQRPEDTIELAAMTLANLKGQAHTYSWAEKTPEVAEGNRYLHFGSEPDEQPIIMRVNLKSENKPFQVFEFGNRVRIFASEQRKGVSLFPWWNHWPVAQIPSDGRYCQAPDRASHFSLAWCGPPTHRGDGDFYWWTWMYGATKRPAETLAPTARAWLRAPRLSGENLTSRYDLSQRCYVVSPNDQEWSQGLRFRLEASPENPVLNPAFIIENWGHREASVSVNGRDVRPGKELRTGYIRRVNRYDLVVWMELQSTSAVAIDLR